jgi:kumamolisin
MAEVPVGYRRIEGSEQGPAAGARRVGPADPNETFSFTIRVRRRPGAPPLPDQEYWAAHPIGKRQFLTPEELAAQSGAAQTDLDKVAEFARSRGFEVVESSAARRTVRVSGTVEQANRTFAVDLGRYESPEETYRGREGAIYLPTEVADLIEGVFGLDNRRMVRRSGGGPPLGAVETTPPEVAKLYDFPSCSAAGQTIGILEFGGGWRKTGALPNQQNDLELFCKGLGLVAPNPKVVSVDGAITSSYNGTLAFPSRNDDEVALDVQVAASVAQGANIVLFFAPNTASGIVDAFTTALYSSPLPLTVLSTSWGASEDTWGDTLNQVDELLIEAAALGITVFADSGDFGSNNASNDGSPHVNFPASDPWVTGCGGTFIADPTATPFIEGTWNDFLIVHGKPTGGATGGGISTSFPVVPSWQTGLTFTAFNPATGKAGPPTPLTGRGVPDVAGNASGFSGYPIVVYGVPFQIGGTSAVPPLYSALVAMIAANSGGPLGYLNPTLYEIGKTAGQKVLVDIHDGANNEVNPGILPTPCTAYVSTKGWDACTGWGRIDGTNLFAVLIETIEATKINPNNPFAFTYEPGSNFTNSWGAAQGALGGGASNSDSRLECGQFNTADNWHSQQDVNPPSPYNRPDDGGTGQFDNGGGGDKSLLGDPTVINTAVAENATFVSDNWYVGSGSIGLFGRSRGTDFSIGVLGQSAQGCAVYGLATDTNDFPPSHGLAPRGIGVVGRSMGGIATEPDSVEELMNEPIGVLGNSNGGTGVRGHAGPLIKLGPCAPASLLTPVASGLGGVFSSGRLQDQVIPDATDAQTVSLDSLAQFRLTPSTNVLLPGTANIGDFFLTLAGGNHNVAMLFLCTQIVQTKTEKNVPLWQQVMLATPPIQGGNAA